MATTTEPAFLKADPPGRGSVFTWIATILACAYIVWMGTMLYISTPKFMDLYSSLNAELPLATRIVSATYRFGFPLFFGGTTALMIAKQFYVRGKWQSLSITLAALVLAAIIGGGIVRALYRPLFDMAEKVSK
jgi:type II secretory pathway component PulF